VSRLSIALTLAAVASAVAPAGLAHADSYSVWSCADAQNRPLSAGDWTPSTVGAQALATSTCGANVTGSTPGNLQSVAGGGPGQPDSAVAAGWTAAATAGTKISALDVWWTNSASVQIPGRISIIASAGPLYVRDAGAFGNVALPFEDGNHQAFTGLAADSAALVASCLSGCARADRAISAVLNAYRVKLTVSDATPPTGQASGTSERVSIRGPVALQARAADVGGGVRDLQLLVDGHVVDTKQAGGTCADISPTTGDEKDYALMRPCLPQFPAAGESPAMFTLTPAMLAIAGAHTVSVVAHDAAGNTGTLLSNRVLVAAALLDGPPPAGRFDAARNLFFNPDVDVNSAGRPNGINAGPANLSLAFVTHRARRKGRLRRTARLSTRRTVSYSTSVRLRGRLTTPTGQPIALARVYRATSVAGGPWTLSTKPLVTSKAGRVSVRLPARAPSRRVALVYFPATSSNASSRSNACLLAVRAPVSLTLSRRGVPRGSRVSVAARIRAGIRPGATVIGALQLHQGRSWRTIRQLRFAPRGHGRARTALRLRVPAVYRLRVRVSAQPGLRYTTGASRARVLEVR
jgi:hypothetical protein